jgi:hypothetical protein
LIKAIEKLFCCANDFSNEDSELINRNFVSHGMNKREVDKIDCIKLIVIIEGLFHIIEVMNLEYKSE